MLGYLSVLRSFLCSPLLAGDLPSTLSCALSGLLSAYLLSQAYSGELDDHLLASGLERGALPYMMSQYRVRRIQ